MAPQEDCVDCISFAEQQDTHTMRIRWAELPDQPARRQIEKNTSQLTPAGQLRGTNYQSRRDGQIPRSQPPTLVTSPHIDVVADRLFRSQRFAYICLRALRLADVLPTEPPPTNFVSFQATRMNTWYLSIFVEFGSRFEKRVRSHDAYPLRPSPDTNERTEDHDRFNRELFAHINSILNCFNDKFERRPLGSTNGLTVDETQENVAVARAALIGATARAVLPPKAQWKHGETLHVEYRRRLRCFRGAVEKYIEYGSPDDRWILMEQEQLSVGLAFHEEYYVRQLREAWFAAHGGRA